MDGPHLQSRLVTLLAESRALELERFDDETGATILRRVVPEVSKLLERGRQLLGEIEDACSSTEAPAASWALPDRVEELENLCFYVAREWKDALEGLERLSETQAGWSCLVQIERARDRLIRGLLAVERGVAEVAGSDSRTGDVDLLDEAIEVRRTLTQFRREIRGAPRVRPETEDLERQLRHAARALARLLDREELARLRAAERHLARDLHRRVEAWLRDGAEGQESGGAEGLWQDVVNFAALLWNVNHRGELVAGDLALITEVQEELDSAAPRKLLPASAAARLQALFGRDDELDDLLEATAESDRVRERLVEVRESLVRERTPQPLSGPGLPREADAG